MTDTCACGCSMPIPTPPRGGYNRTLNQTLWFATTKCQARFESARIRITRGPAYQADPTALRLTHIQQQVREDYP